MDFEYRETKIGKTLYRVTSVYSGKADLTKALEELTVRRILRCENYDQTNSAQSGHICPPE